MIKNKFLDFIHNSWKNDNPPLLLKSLAFFYGLASGFNRKYLTNPKSIAIPTIAVGNLTVGGTGKTPFTIWLAQEFVKLGLKPAIISRGYKRTAEKDGQTLIVSKGNGPLVSTHLAGDEPYLIAEQVPGALVLVNKNRYKAAEIALEEKASLIILDDGYQQKTLKADYKILLMPMNKPFANNYLLPAGPLREKIINHQLADIIVAVGKTPFDKVDQQIIELSGARPLFKAYYQAKSYRFLASNEVLPLGTRFRGKIIAFCGLAKPSGFIEFLNSLDIKPEKFLTFPDHYDYKDISILEKIFKDEKPDYFITTAKDAVKLNFPAEIQNKIIVLDIKLETEKHLIDLINLGKA